MLHRELLVAGHLFGGSCDQSIGKEPVRSPWDGRVVGTAAEAGPAELETALASAHEAFPEWSRSSVRERQRLLRRVSQAFQDRSEELAQLLVDEIGKPISFARAEVARAALTFSLAADELTRPSGTLLPAGFDPRGDNVTIRTQSFPVGVVLCITPYNWPFNLAAHKVAPALAAGNTVILKAPSLAPLSGLTLGQILLEAGCPDGVVQCVHCPNGLAEKMVTDDRVAMISFTGSRTVGRHIQKLVPHKRVALELGGDAYVLVGQDADLDNVVARVVPSAYGYAGQVCISAQHLVCHESVRDELQEMLVAATDSCPTGDPADETTVCGPLIHSAAADRVVEWTEEAEAGGAQVLTGGHRVGNTVWPTLVADVPPTSRLAREEVFGPALTLSSFTTWQEAFARVNGSQFGLQASLFTRDLDVVEEAFQTLRVGGVVVNDAPSLRFDNMPYGGEKESGDTREGVAAAMREMSTERVLVTRHRPVT
ncbi:MAG: aldehyde dehydrogenase family protein [Armatimonadetes bacterium]|nr:aldehyde dehydrogenase family protein [Armatimonadota bacterium]